MSVATDKLAAVSALLTQFESDASTFISSRSSFEGSKTKLSVALSELQSEFASASAAAEVPAPPTV